MINYIEKGKPETPSVLYKYRSWENELHKKILLENKVYLASPKSFEDKLDCNVPENFPNTEQEVFDYICGKLKEEYPQLSRSKRKILAKKLSKESPLSNPKKRDALNEKIKQKYFSHLGVLSMTEDCDNDKMWCEYANDHQGICIGFDTNLLFDCVGGGGHVTYRKKLEPIDFIKDDFYTAYPKNIFQKEEKWKYEKEYRLKKIWENEVSDEERNVLLPNNCIIEVILGKKISSMSKKEIIAVVKAKHPNAKIIER